LSKISKLRGQLLLGTALFGSVFAFSGTRAYALKECEEVNVGSGFYLCAGSADSTQELSGAPLTVIADFFGFSIDATTGNAFKLTGTGGLTFTGKYISTIKGESTGIVAYNNSSGALTITTYGTVTGTNARGIYAYNKAGTTGLTIDAAAVTGGTDGIFANNLGTGALSITASGDVEGTNYEGINASQRAGGTGGLVIDAAQVTGGNYGIRAKNYGSAELSITTSGDVTGSHSNGIDAINASTGTALTIDAKAKVTGYLLGIHAANEGNGALSITAGGDVTGTHSNGIDATNSGTTLTIDAKAKVTGDSIGIHATNYGTDALSIYAGGDVTGTQSDGNLAVNYGTALTIDAKAKMTGDAYGKGTVGVRIKW
jgi:hypothetical protein